MKKDKEWLKNDIMDYKKLILEHADEHEKDAMIRVINSVAERIGQLDEPEITEEQAINALEEKGYTIARMYDRDNKTVLPYDFYRQVLLAHGYEVVEKSVIPQFVADWFEKNKDLTFIEAMDELFWDHHDEKMVEFLISEDNEHIRENQELLMKVWLYADYGGKGMNRTILHTQSKDSFIKYLESELAAKNQTLNAYREINEQLSTENKQLRRDNVALKKEDGEVMS